MKWIASRTSLGFLLIAGGALFLLQNLGLLPDAEWLWIVVFTAIGLFFLVYFLSAGENWWAAIPAFGALGIAGTIAVEALTGFPDETAGAAFLGSGALAFLAIYFRRREHWWPILVAGAMLSIVGVILSTVFPSGLGGELGPVIMFSILALTFMLVYLTPTEGGRARWAIWPALGCFLLAGIVGIAVYDLFNQLFPILLIAAGAALLLRPRKKKKKAAEIE